MCRLAAHFIAKQELIQARANAYVRTKLCSAEYILNGLILCQSE